MKNLSRVSVIALVVLTMSSCATVSKTSVVRPELRSEVKSQDSKLVVVQFKDNNGFTVIPSYSAKSK
jgi:hypothetical protein